MAHDITAGKRRRWRPPLEVIVVEDHHDVLPWVHLWLRRKVVPRRGVRFVHLDAHPDLGGLQDASLCKRPHDLVAYLDESEYGISEWLLPLVFCGHLHRISWLRPPFATQIPDGRYDVRVGADVATGRLAVDLNLKYFREDGAFSENLRDAVPFALDVGEALAAEEDDSPWILDVCLDYFSCLDPFDGATDDRRSTPLPVGGAQKAEDVDLSVLLDVLARLPRPPAVVTVARSARDGYTPAHIADDLETKVLAALADHGHLLNVHRDLDGQGPPPALVEPPFFVAKKQRSSSSCSSPAAWTATSVSHLPP